MFRVSRVLLSKSAVRPVLNAGAKAGAGPPQPPNRPRITPIGIAFILGGLALGSYMLKPTTRMPTAAMDTFKPQVAIVFAKGDSKGAAQDAARKLGLQYLDMRRGLDQLGTLADKGYTRFLIDGFSTTDEIASVENNVVAPDLVLDFDDKPLEGLRIVPVSNGVSVEQVIRDRNLV